MPLDKNIIWQKARNTPSLLHFITHICCTNNIDHISIV